MSTSEIHYYPNKTVSVRFFVSTLGIYDLNIELPVQNAVSKCFNKVIDFFLSFASPVLKKVFSVRNFTSTNVS